MIRAQLFGRRCVVDGCTSTRAPGVPFCARCWRAVPVELQLGVLRAVERAVHALTD